MQQEYKIKTTIRILNKYHPKWKFKSLNNYYETLSIGLLFDSG